MKICALLLLVMCAGLDVQAQVTGEKKGHPEAKTTPNPKQAPPEPSVVETEAQRRARAIILPRVEFEEATVAECLEFLRVKTAAMRNPDGDSLAVNVVLKVPKSTTLPKITLSLNMIPLSETLRYIAELSGLKLRVEQDVFVLEVK